MKQCQIYMHADVDILRVTDLEVNTLLYIGLYAYASVDMCLPITASVWNNDNTYHT